MHFIDTHTHIYSEEFNEDRAEVVKRALEAGATHLLLPNCDEPSLRPILNMCHDYPGICLPMIGLHPTEMPEDPHALLDRMEAELAAPNSPYIAVGEVGVDLYWDQSRRDEQIDVFRRQIEWSIQYQLPLSIHMRSAHREMVDTLQPYREQLPGGVFHCFGGTAEEAQELIELFPNFVFGIGGVVTFKKSLLPAILRTTIPLNRIVTETDAPYLTPTPYRGKRNEPAFIPFVVAKLAEIYDRTPEEVGEITSKTARKVFKIDPQ